MTSQALLRANLEIIHDRKGRTLVSHLQGEAVMLYRCKPTEVRIRHNEDRCCKELPIWHGKNFSTPAFIQPIIKKVSSISSSGSDPGVGCVSRSTREVLASGRLTARFSSEEYFFLRRTTIGRNLSFCLFSRLACS